MIRLSTTCRSIRQSEGVVIVEGLLQAASALEDLGAPYDVIGRLYESYAQTVLIKGGVTVDLMQLCGFDNPSALQVA